MNANLADVFLLILNSGFLFKIRIQDVDSLNEVLEEMSECSTFKANLMKMLEVDQKKRVKLRYDFLDSKRNI